MIRKNFTFLGSLILFAITCLVGTVSAQTTVTFSSAVGNVAVPDDGYNGTLASMANKTIAVAGIPAGATINSISIRTRIATTWGGDVTIKMTAPGAVPVMTLMNRPGQVVPDDGSGGAGTANDFIIANATTFVDGGANGSAENIGNLGNPIPVASVFPAADGVAGPATFAALATAIGNSSNLNGTWTVYVGDGFLGDPTTFNQAEVIITYTVVVVDPCVLTCPGNVTVNLDPGACSQIVNYDVTFSGNCAVPIITPATISQNTSLTTVDDALSCTGPGDSHWRAYDLVAQGITGSFTMNSLTMAAWGSGTVQVFVYTYTGTVGAATLNTGLMTLVGSSAPTPVVGSGAADVTFTIPLLAPAVIPAGAKFAVEQRVTAGGLFSVAANYGGQSQPCYFQAAPCGIGVPTSYANIGFGFIHLLQVLNGTSVQLGTPDIVQISGLPSGGDFPIGTTQNCFELVSPLTGQVIADCCFDVNVLEYPFPVTSLTCNDLVYFSVDENCQGVVLADDVLEGGPYGCYDDYIVELDRTPPFGNGPWTPAIVGPADIGKTYQVRVTDPTTGNRCWGNIKFEDKLPPELTCFDLNLPCNADTDPIFTAIDLAGQAKGNVPVNIIDNQTVTSTANFSAPPGSTILDVNLRLNITHTWIGDLDIILTSPSGTNFQVWNNNCNTFDNLIFTYDDESPFCSTLCVDFSQGLVMQPLACGGPGTGSTDFLSKFDGEDPTGAWTLSMNDNAFGDQGTLNDFTLFITYNSPNGTAPIVTDNCGVTGLTYVDTEINGSCVAGVSKTIIRKWTATDASGNTATCQQNIGLTLPTFDDLTLPPDYDGIDAPFFLCIDNAYPTPQWIEGQGLQGWPYVFGLPEGCTINWEYEDLVIEVCDGTYKIRRQWTIIDWCIGESFEYNQIIKVVDDQGPSLDCPANMTVSTDPFTCCATINLPDVIIEDNCSQINNISGMVVLFDPFTGDQTGMVTFGGTLTSFPGNNFWDLDTLGNFGWTPCLPVGTHTVIYTAEDDCGNTSTCSFRLTVRDLVPPVAACDEFTVVAIGIDDPFDCYGPAGPNDQPPALDACNFAGVTWVKAKTFDDGSYDNCNNVHFTVRRMGPDYSDCIFGLNQTNGFLPCDDIFADFPSEFERAISEYDSIKFYCCEVGTTQTVILRVYQIDVNGNISIGLDGTPIFNECMVQVEVQDKIKPVCISPPHVTVSCENFDPSLWVYGKPHIEDNCCLDTTKNYQGQCGLQHTANYNLFDTVCNRGTIVRTFRAFDCHGFSSQCTQRIIVNYEQDYFVKFPNDVIVTVCDGTGNYGEPIIFGEDCELIGVNYEDQIFTVVPDACFKIERTWTIINWCTYNPNLPCIEVPNPNPNATVNHPSNLPGPTVSACGTLPPWAPTVVKINPSDPTTTNYCIFYDANANCYKYKQIIKVIDTQDPIVTCPASPVEFCDLTPNNPLLWNEMYWWDNVIGSHDLCEGPTDLCITATDACSGANINIKYLLFLDLDGDGVMETVINSVTTGISGLGWNTVYFNNAGNPNFSGGIPRSFDERPVPFNQKWGFAIQNTVSGNNKTACVRWNTQQSQGTYVIPELPYGTHKIKWFIEDGCGNETVCEYTFIVKDCKKPTVVCLNGLSVNIMPTGMITLWASDFLQYTEDNCTPANLLKIGIRKSGTGTGFPVDGNGQPITSVTFTCDELGTQLVELWSIDLAGNADFCETYVIVQDNMGICPPTPGGGAKVAGALTTDVNNDGVEDGSVGITGAGPGIPNFTFTTMSNDQGAYNFNAIPTSSNSTVTPTKDDNPLNGVTTYDLVLISKHILGLEPLNTPYKMIAADANNNGSITTFDIVEVRKLILGIYQELPNNTSWRFVDKSFTFTNPNNPFIDQFPENKTIMNIQANKLNEDFVSVKVGDVNQTAIANSLMSADDRSAGTLLFDVEDRMVKAGESFTLNFKAAEKVQGYQFTMNLNGLEVADITPGANMAVENFGVFADAITTSYDGAAQGEFAVTFRAVKSGKISEWDPLESTCRHASLSIL